MVSEKLIASEAAATLLGGGSVESIVRCYRTIVRANQKRPSGPQRTAGKAESCGRNVDQATCF
jgi:hypothetical protein